MPILTTAALAALYPSLVAVSKNAVIQGWTGNVIAGLTSRLLEGTLDGLTRERRNRLKGKDIHARLGQALELAITATLHQLGQSLPSDQRQPFAEALQTWVAEEKVQDCFGRLLDPHKGDALALKVLTECFAESSLEALNWSLELDFPAFLTCLAGCFQAAVQTDDVLREHFALTDMEELVRQAETQSGLLEQLQKDTALSARIQAMMLEASHQIAASTAVTADHTRQIAQNSRAAAATASEQLQEQKKTNRRLKNVGRALSQPKKEKEEFRRAARIAWLKVVTQDSASIPLQGLDTDASDSERARTTPLSGIYIALNTTAWVEVKKGEHEPDARLRLPPGVRVSRPITVLEATARTPRMALLGVPGGGKSTFVRHLAYSLAQGQLAADEASREKWLRQLQPLRSRQLKLLPVIIVLRELAAWLAAAEPDTRAETLTVSRSQALFKGYLEHWCQLNDKRACLGEVWRALEQGTALLLLDGLDEIPATGPRIDQVKAMLEGLAEGWAKSPMLVTCRVLSWQDPRWKLESRWGVFELDSLNDEQIADFIRRWYQQLAAGGHVKQPEEKIQRLQQAVRSPELRELAGNPLLLTVMALLHGHRGELPDSRVLLYEETVDLLLQRWERTNKPDLDRSRALQDWLAQAPCQLTELKRALSRLAFQAHQRGGELAQKDGGSSTVTADISESELQLELAKLHPRQELLWARVGVDLIKERAGLLVESQPGVYHFPHRTFQEYLAARYLGGQADYAKQSLTLAKQGSYWWEALRLSAARLVQVEVGDKALGLIAALSPSKEPSVADASAWRLIWLAGELLKSILGYAQSESLGQELLERTKAHLVRLLELGLLSERERCEAGLVLGHLGDPRLGLEREDRWVWIEPGEFTIGSERENESPPHRVRITRGFWLAKFPVTNQEYRAFIEDGGYRERKWWSKEGWDEKESEEITLPGTWGEPYSDAPNLPVVSISWYEAQAFGSWLTERWREKLPASLITKIGRLGEGGFVVRLPTEAEWEFGARGTGSRIYPWGDQPAPTGERANYDSRLGRTSPVGAYPLGATPEGALDMAGNVSEWCIDAYIGGHPASSTTELNLRVTTETDKRVVRGSSFCDGKGKQPAFFREEGFWTKSGATDVGFRPVIAPSISEPDPEP